MKKIIFGIFLLLTTKTIFANTILLETFTRENSVYSSNGWGLVSDDSYLGVKFSVEDSMFIESILANVGGDGEFFTGIVQLASRSSVPTIAPGFSSNDFLFYTTNRYNRLQPSFDVITQAGVLLTKGDYAVIFGGVGDVLGVMPGTPALQTSTIPLSDYIEYRSEENGWVEFDYSGIRVVLEGELNPVPLPAGLYLFLSGLSVIVVRAKRKTSNNSFKHGLRFATAT